MHFTTTYVVTFPSRVILTKDRNMACHNYDVVACYFGMLMINEMYWLSYLLSFDWYRTWRHLLCSKFVASCISLVQFSSIPWPIGLSGRWLWQMIQQRSSSSRFLQEALASSSCMGRNTHSLMLSIQHFLCRPRRCPPSEMPWRMVLERLSWRVTCPNLASFRLLTVARRASFWSFVFSAVWK